MKRLSEEEKKYLQYQIYSFRYDDPWITNKKIARFVNRSVSTVNRYATRAEEQGILLNPHLRLKSYPGKTALLLFEDKWKAFKELQLDAHIKYLSLYQGDWDILAVHEGIDFSQISSYRKTVVEGIRGRIFTPKVKYTSWENCFAEMENLLTQEKIEKSTFDWKPSTPDWNEEDWKLYHYFKPNVRRSFTTLRKTCPISWETYGRWKKSVRDYCAILVSYFPEGYHRYECLSLCFRTEYEKYIIGLFSNLPATPNFYKIGDYFFAGIYVPRDYQYSMKIFNIISRLIENQIVTECMEGKGVVTWHDRVMI
jgi:DNA-binding Lrp family transcriptional regulator